MTTEQPDLASIPFPAEEIERLPERAAALSHAKSRGRVAEIGVYRGHFSEVILERLQPSVFYMVDRWTLAGETFGWRSEYDGFGALTTKLAKDDSIRRASRFRGSSIHIVEADAVDFAREAKRQKVRLDMVYLDTDHRYEPTLQQLVALQDIVADDGVIIGDDWEPDPAHPHHAVFQAVNDFLKVSDFDLVTAGQAKQYCLRRRPPVGG